MDARFGRLHVLMRLTRFLRDLWYNFYGNFFGGIDSVEGAISSSTTLGVSREDIVHLTSDGGGAPLCGSLVEMGWNGVVSRPNDTPW